MGTLQYMTPKAGDARQVWDPKNAEEVEVARRVFNDLIGKGYMAYTVKGRTGRGEQVTSFDPKLGRIILIPQMQGG